MGGVNRRNSGRSAAGIGVTLPVNHPFIFVFSSFSILFIFSKHQRLSVLQRLKTVK